MWLRLLGCFLIVFWAGCKGQSDVEELDTSEVVTDTAIPDDTGTKPQDWWLHETIESLVYVSWTQEDEANVAVEYRFDGEDWRISPEKLRQAGDHTQILVGIPYDTDFEYRLVYYTDKGPDKSDLTAGRTGEIPVSGLTPEVLASNPSRSEATGGYLLGSVNVTNSGWVHGDYWMYIIDDQARVVWAYLVPDRHFCIHAGLSLDKQSLVWDDLSYWTEFDRGADSVANWMKLDGTIETSVPIPGANHAFTELSDGSVAWWAMDLDSNTYDGELKIMGPDGKVESVWSCKDFMAEQGMSGSCLANTVYWHEATDTFVLSFAMADFVVEVERYTLQSTLRSFGDTPSAWEFSDPDTVFYVQHAASYTDTGTLLLSTHTHANTNEAVVREYEVDEKTQELVEVWTYGEGAGVNAPLGGYVERLPSGNTLHNYGLTPRAKEIANDGEVVWDLLWPVPGQIGRTVLIDDLYALVE